MTNMKTFTEMTAETRVIQTEKGWRDGGKTFGDFIELMHTEVSEAMEAWRVHGLDDFTAPQQGDVLPKPEGVGAEMADVFIRFLDTCDVIGLKLVQKRTRGGGWKGEEEVHLGLDDIESADPSDVLRKGQAPGPLISFGDHLAWLDRCISQMWMDPDAAEYVLIALVTIARKYEINLMAEYERKQAHNRTRSYRHGNKRL